MKKLAPVWAALLALTACTAAPTETAAVPAATEPPAEAATAEESAAAEQFTVGTLHLTTFDNTNGTALYGGFSSGNNTVWTVLRLDYATGVQSKLCDLTFTDGRNINSLLAMGENEVAFCSDEDDTQHSYIVVHPDGTTDDHSISRAFSPTVYDEYAAYEINGTNCARLDWQTGEVTDFTAPLLQLASVEGVVDNRLFVTRIVSDTPLPAEGEDDERREAILQNSLREYDLYDLAANTLTLYKLADGTTHDVPYPVPAGGQYGTGENYGWPLDLTGDGRILVTDGYAPQGGYATDGYALIDVDAYLSGSTDYTPVQMWEG